MEQHYIDAGMITVTTRSVQPAQPEQPVPVQLRPAEGDVGAVVLVTDDEGTGMMQGLPF